MDDKTALPTEQMLFICVATVHILRLAVYQPSKTFHFTEYQDSRALPLIQDDGQGWKVHTHLRLPEIVPGYIYSST